MTSQPTCSLEQLPSCQKVPEHHDPASWEGAPFRQGYILDERFVITDVLSRSGMGTVFKAEDREQNNTPVAIKVPHLEYESDVGFFDRFKREERIGLELSHPFLLKFFPVKGTKSRPYLVTEYLRGCTLEHLLRAMRPLPEKDALKIASLVCEALDYMHGHGFVHRDLKPQNIMICCDRTIRIMDFGIARHTTARGITRVGTAPAMGTIDYMSPEQVMGRRADKRSDIYSLGAVLYELLTGATPFQNENPWVAMNARVSGDPVPPRKVNPDLSAQAEEIVLRAMQRNPHARYQSAAAFKSDLDNAEHIRVTGLAGRVQEAAPWKPAWLQRPAVLVSLMLGPLAVGLGVLLWFLLRHP
jgi:serine/threonine-protein kinase